VCVVCSGSIERLTGICRQLETVCSLRANNVALSAVEVSQRHWSNWQLLTVSDVRVSWIWQVLLYDIFCLGELEETSPCTAWMKTIQQDLKSNNLSLNEAIDVAQNRPLQRLMSMFDVAHSWWCLTEIMMTMLYCTPDSVQCRHRCC